MIKKNIVALLDSAAEGGLLTSKQLAALADGYWRLYNDRLAADKEAAALKAEEVKVSATIIQQLQASEVTSIGGKNIKLEVRESDVARVADWPKFYAHVLKTKDFSLLERRPGQAAIKERWEAGKAVPGVEKFPVYKLSKSQVK